jgi:hypothetical protein
MQGGSLIIGRSLERLIDRLRKEMNTMYPSIKSLSQIKNCDTKLTRRILECKDMTALAYIRDEKQELFASVDQWIYSCHNPPSFHSIKMAMLDKAIDTYGVKYISHGLNSRSPAIEYLNTGDPYTSTLLFVNGQYRVGCWGDIVERGNYE